MAQRHRASHGSLFLMELIFSILLFTIIATICIVGFVKSHTLSRDASLQTHYVTMASNVAEVIRSGESVEQTIKSFETYYPNAVILLGDGSQEVPLSKANMTESDLPAVLHIFYDEEFHPCAHEDAAYTTEVKVGMESGLATADIGVRVGGNTAHVYDLTIEHFFHEYTGE